jgi:hypothetical protein
MPSPAFSGRQSRKGLGPDPCVLVGPAEAEKLTSWRRETAQPVPRLPRSCYE